MKIRTWHMMSLPVIALGIICASCSADHSAAGQKNPASSRTKMQFPVETVIRVQNRAVTYSLNAVGSVEAFEKVQITARVAGVVEKVQFTEGESRRFRADAGGNRAAALQLGGGIGPGLVCTRPRPLKAMPMPGLKRRETVDTQNPGLIPGEEIEAWRTKVLVAAAEMAQTGAALNQAKLNLHDAYVRAPVAGLVQTRTVQTGQYVQPGTVLATLMRRDPLLLRFQATEQDAGRLRPGMKAFFKIRDETRAMRQKSSMSPRPLMKTPAWSPSPPRLSTARENSLRSGSFAEVTVPVGNSRPPAGHAPDGHPSQ